MTTVLHYEILRQELTSPVCWLLTLQCQLQPDILLWAVQCKKANSLYCSFLHTLLIAHSTNSWSCLHMHFVHGKGILSIFTYYHVWMKQGILPQVWVTQRRNFKSNMFRSTILASQTVKHVVGHILPLSAYWTDKWAVNTVTCIIPLHNVV